MKNNNDINTSLSEIKKVLTEEKKEAKENFKADDFFLLKNVIKKGNIQDNKNKSSQYKQSFVNKSEKENFNKQNISKKTKIKKNKLLQTKKVDSKNNTLDSVIDTEIKPIIRSWIKKNLRDFVKKIVLEEFQTISKAISKQKSVSK